MVVYLPIVVLRDCASTLIKPDFYRNLYNGFTVTSSSINLGTPLIVNEIPPSSEASLRNYHVTTNTDLREREEGLPFVAKKGEDDAPLFEQSSKLGSWEIAKCSFYLSLVWFITEVNITNL